MRLRAQMERVWYASDRRGPTLTVLHILAQARKRIDYGNRRRSRTSADQVLWRSSYSRSRDLVATPAQSGGLVERGFVWSPRVQVSIEQRPWDYSPMGQP